MKRMLVISLLLTTANVGSSQQIPAPTELLGKVFSVKSTWKIGAGTDWDFIKIDPSYKRLYVTHGKVVQAIDLESGLVTGEIDGFYDARDIALDDRGEFGYVSDSPTNQVIVFDRRTLAIVAYIPTAPNPRAVVFDPVTGSCYSQSVMTLIPPIPTRSAGLWWALTSQQLSLAPMSTGCLQSHSTGHGAPGSFRTVLPVRTRGTCIRPLPLLMLINGWRSVPCRCRAKQVPL